MTYTLSGGALNSIQTKPTQTFLVLPTKPGRKVAAYAIFPIPVLDPFSWTNVTLMQILKTPNDPVCACKFVCALQLYYLYSVRILVVV